MKYVILMLLFSGHMWSQNLDEHLWKERVIVISSNKSDADKSQIQIDLLLAEKQKFIDRKVVIYKCIEGVCEFYDGKQKPKIVRTNMSPKAFSTVLIGLDGGEKYKSNNVQSPALFFQRIDVMPMRRQELKNQNDDND